MKLYTNTVSNLLINSLEKLMYLEEFNKFRLVGGTSLSLQLGHRESIDIDLFTDAEYASIDFDKIDKTLKKEFPYTESLYEGKVAMGKSYFIGKNENNLIKLDLFYTEDFITPPLVYKNIRLARIEEIAAMKLQVIGNGGRKKDFWDLHELLDHFSLEQMIDFYQKKYPYNQTKEDLLKKLTDFKDAEGEFLPNCYRDKDWDIIKLDFEELIKK